MSIVLLLDLDTVLIKAHLGYKNKNKKTTGQAVLRYLSSILLASMEVEMFSALWCRVLIALSLCCSG